MGRCAQQVGWKGADGLCINIAINFANTGIRNNSAASKAQHLLFSAVRSISK